MENNNLPLEHLTAFALVFAAGVLSTIGFSKYIDKVRRDTIRETRIVKSE